MAVTRAQFRTLGRKLRRLLHFVADRATLETVVDLITDGVPNPPGGSVPVAILNLATNPTAGDTLTIGSDVYEFRAAAGSLANDGNIAVAIGAAVGDTQTNLINAINAVDANNLHPTVFKSDGVTPAKANGTMAIVADEPVANKIRIKYADEAGGTAIAGDPSISLGEALTAAADIWEVGNVNLNTLAGRLAYQDQSVATLTITAAMVTATRVRIAFPFTVGHYMVQIRSSAGKLRNEALSDDTFTIDNGDILIGLAGGAAPDIQATDTVTVIATT